MAKKIKYDAFISYRHCFPDAQIAERLQKKLEAFRLPDDVAKKLRRTRLRRVFRDETELSVADDLSEAITDALENSEFLIAVCSPQYLESKWCMKEIQTFLRFRDRKHVLLVLADDEPEVSVPEILMYEEVYTTDEKGMPAFGRVPREPLAADCRGETEKERNAKIDKAVVRLVSAIFGLGYDDLQQRHKRALMAKRKRRLITAFSILGAVIALCVGFIVYIAGQNGKIRKQKNEIESQNAAIEQQNEIITQKYVDSLAASSDNLLRDGKRKAAVYAARQALPDDRKDTYSEPALQALTKALGIYNPPDTFTCEGDIALPEAQLDFEISPGTRYVLYRGLDHSMNIFDRETGEVLLTYMEAHANVFDYAFDGDRGFVFQREGENYKYFDLASHTEADLGFSVGDTWYDMRGNGYYFRTEDGADLYQGTSCFCHFVLQNEIPGCSDRFDVYVTFSSDGNSAMLVVYDYDNMETNMFSIAVSGGSVKSVDIPHDGLLFNISTDGEHVVWTQNNGNYSDLYVKDVNSSREAKSCTIPFDTFGVVVHGNDIVTYTSEKIYLWDIDLNPGPSYEIREEVRHLVVTGHEITLQDALGFHVVRDGVYTYVDPEFPADAQYVDEFYSDEVLYMAEWADSHIYTYTYSQTDYFEHYSIQDGNYRELEAHGFEDPEDENFKQFILTKETEFDANTVYTCVKCENADCGFLQLWDGTTYIYDSTTGERLKETSTVRGYAFIFYYDDASEMYYLGSQNVEVFDKDMKLMYRLPGMLLQGIDYSTGDLVVSREDENNVDFYLVHLLRYDELIDLADAYLGDYEPDAAVKEKYGLS